MRSQTIKHITIQKGLWLQSVEYLLHKPAAAVLFRYLVAAGSHSTYIHTYIYIYIHWLFAPSPNHQLCLLLPRVCFFQDVSKTSFERIWANLNGFGSLFWHPFGEKLGPFWGVGSRPHFVSLLELFLVLPAPPRGTLLEAFSAHVAIQRRPEAEN